MSSTPNNAWRLLALALALAVAAGCATDAPEVPPVDAEPALWAADFETAMAPVRGCRLSPAEHDGFYIRVFANSGSAQAYVDGTYPFVEGTLLVKGEYEDADCTDLRRVSAMLKLADGAAPELGDWRWQRRAMPGQTTAAMAAKSCAGCHKACVASDYACTEP